MDEQKELERKMSMSLDDIIRMRQEPSKQRRPRQAFQLPLPPDNMPTIPNAMRIVIRREPEGAFAATCSDRSGTAEVTEAQPQPHRLHRDPAPENRRRTREAAAGATMIDVSEKAKEMEAMARWAEERVEARRKEDGEGSSHRPQLFTLRKRHYGETEENGYKRTRFNNDRDQLPRVTASSLLGTPRSIRGQSPLRSLPRRLPPPPPLPSTRNGITYNLGDRSDSHFVRMDKWSAPVEPRSRGGNIRRPSSRRASTPPPPPPLLPLGLGRDNRTVSAAHLGLSSAAILSQRSDLQSSLKLYNGAGTLARMTSANPDVRCSHCDRKGHNSRECRSAGNWKESRPSGLSRMAQESMGSMSRSMPVGSRTRTTRDEIRSRSHAANEKGSSGLWGPASSRW